MTYQSDISSPNSIDSQDQSLREASQDIGSMSSQFANEEMSFDFSSNNEPMDEVSDLPDSSYSNWDIQNAPNFAADLIDPALQFPSLGAWPVRTGVCEQDWTLQDLIMADWAIDFPPAPVTPQSCAWTSSFSLARCFQSNGKFLRTKIEMDKRCLSFTRPTGKRKMFCPKTMNGV